MEWNKRTKDTFHSWILVSMLRLSRIRIDRSEGGSLVVGQALYSLAYLFLEPHCLPGSEVAWSCVLQSPPACLHNTVVKSPPLSWHSLDFGMEGLAPARFSLPSSPHRNILGVPDKGRGREKVRGKHTVKCWIKDLWRWLSQESAFRASMVTWAPTPNMLVQNQRQTTWLQPQC